MTLPMRRRTVIARIAVSRSRPDQNLKHRHPAARLLRASALRAARRKSSRYPARCRASRSSSRRARAERIGQRRREEREDLAPAEEHHARQQHEQHGVPRGVSSHSAIATPSSANAKHIVFSRPTRSDTQPNNGRVRPLVKRSMVSASGRRRHAEHEHVGDAEIRRERRHLRGDHQAGRRHHRHHREHQPEKRRPEHLAGRSFGTLEAFGAAPPTGAAAACAGGVRKPSDARKPTTAETAP